MTMRDEIIEMYEAHPDWTAQQIGRVVDCDPAYVRSVKSRYNASQGGETPSLNSKSLEIRILAEVNKGRPLTYGDLETRLGIHPREMSMHVRRLKAAGKIEVSHLSLGNEKIAIMERVA